MAALDTAGIPVLMLKVKGAVRAESCCHWTLRLAGSLGAEGCPSRKVRRAAWTVAVSPRSQGHGHARPWDREDALRTRISADDENGGAAGSVSRTGGLARGFLYLRAVLGPGPAAPAAP